MNEQTTNDIQAVEPIMGATETDGALETEGSTRSSLEAWRAVAADGDKRLQKMLEGVKSLPVLARSYAEARHAISSGRFKDKIVVPGGDATEEEWARFQSNLPERMRPPANAGEYEIIHPDNITLDEAGNARMAQVYEAAHRLGVSNDQLQGLLSLYYEILTDVVEQEQATARNYQTETDSALRKEWGRDYDQNTEYAGRLISSRLGGTGLETAMLSDGTALATHPAFLKLAAEMGRLTSEDRMMTGGKDPDTQKSLQDRIDEITEKAHAEGNYFTDKVQKKLRPLYEQLYGTAPADGRVG